MMRTLLLLGGRVRRPPVLRAGAVAVTHGAKDDARAARHRAEMEAEKQFLRLIHTARIRQQRRIAEAIKRAVAAKSECPATPKQDVRYAKNRQIAKTELAAVEKEMAQRAAETKKPQAASPSVGKKGRPSKVVPPRQPSTMDKKKQVAKEERFLASLRRRIEQRNARIRAIVAKTVKLEAAKAKTKVKVEAIAEAAVRDKAEALRKAEATAKAEQNFDETIRRRQEQRAARIKAIVEKRMKTAAAEAEATSASVDKKFSAKLQQLEEERDARVQAIIAEYMGAADVTKGEENTDTPAVVPIAAVSTSRRPNKKVSAAAAALPEMSDYAATPSAVPQEDVPMETEAIEASAEKTMTPPRRHRLARTEPHETTKVPIPASVEPVEKATATMPDIEEANVAAQLPPSPPRPRQSAAADPEALAIAHENFVAHLKKAKERTTAPPSTRVVPMSRATASSSPAPRSWVAVENPTGLFRL
ncbi:hypothetical protein JIQ42_02135 [Leishmania sp. Namibia]|uniref:hypothetical protein n=1 Tax=Leishmania sp. Namibia TaxID=2802991 RepID=UPI001B7B1005|nr:hypothetical protein JIQ42_02135 [Leishmania sp. Namibia]